MRYSFLRGFNLSLNLIIVFFLLGCNIHGTVSITYFIFLVIRFIYLYLIFAIFQLICNNLCIYIEFSTTLPSRASNDPLNSSKNLGAIPNEIETESAVSSLGYNLYTLILFFFFIYPTMVS